MENNTSHLKVKYPHMLKNDVSLWESFLKLYGDYFDVFDYDVHLGEGNPVKLPALPNIVSATKSLTQKRIDAVGYRNDEVWIFEVKPDAGLSALGQLIGYRDLWIRERGRPDIFYQAIVTDFLGVDDKYLFELHGIKTYTV